MSTWTIISAILGSGALAAVISGVFSAFGARRERLHRAELAERDREHRRELAEFQLEAEEGRVARAHAAALRRERREAYERYIQLIDFGGGGTIIAPDRDDLDEIGGLHAKLLLIGPPPVVEAVEAFGDGLAEWLDQEEAQISAEGAPLPLVTKWQRLVQAMREDMKEPPPS